MHSIVSLKPAKVFDDYEKLGLNVGAEVTAFKMSEDNVEFYTAEGATHEISRDQCYF